MTRDYSVFGLKVRSELELPELFTDESDAPVDISIGFGTLDASPINPGLHAVGDGVLVLVITGVARFQIEGGCSIIVEPVSGVAERNVRLFLLGSAIGALLHQRGLLPLHANAIEVDGKAVAFMGESGAGKSTLAAWMHERGYRVIADDVCVVRFDDAGQARASVGLPRLRLWLEALTAFGRDPSSYARSYVGHEDFQNYEKYDVPVTRGEAPPSELELAGAYLLCKGDTLQMQRLKGIEAAEAVFSHTYRGGFLEATTGHEAHWAASVRLIQGTPIYRLDRKWDLARLDEDGPQILEHVRREIIGARE